MRAFITDLMDRNGPDGAADLAVALALQHFIALDKLALRDELPSSALLDELELEHLDD